MSTDASLEQYLFKLDKALGQMSVSDRAEIITEIKSHILDSVERNTDQGIQQTLDALGAPEVVANRYLMEKGLKPMKPGKSPTIKWLTIGFLGTLGIFFLFVTILIWKFTPIIKIDGANERISILGGLIDIDGNDGKFNVDGKINIEGKKRSFKGSKDIAGSSIKIVKVTFLNANLKIYSSKSNQLTWDCKLSEEKESKNVSEIGEEFILSFNNTKTAKCDVYVPATVSLKLEGGNGKIDFEKISFAVDANVVNGDISFTPEAAQKYKFETEIVNGSVNGLNSSPVKDALLIKIKIINGKVAGNES